MDIRPLTDSYAVAPQITPEDMAAIRAAGFTTVIDNRPDAEIPPDLRAGPMGEAARAAGLDFVVNPVVGGQITTENVTAQRDAMAAARGPVLAYCASGNRSSIVWALARAGTIGIDELIAIPARWGYNLEPFRPLLSDLAARR
ncbi:protein tyrosine phosphatase family protein [Albidovulum sp.]